MAVDLKGIIGHSLSKKEIVELPKQINEWDDVNQFFSSYDNRNFKKAEWYGYIDEEQLELIWRYYETPDTNKDLLNKILNFDSVIHCPFGTLSIFRKTILITHWSHKYDNLRNPETARNILTLNRLLASHFNQDKILYCPDSAYPTAAIEEKAVEGLEIKELIEYGINRFGVPPLKLDEARKYMFFIDSLNENLDKLTDWQGESPYWYYDFQTNTYKLIKQ